MRENLNSIIENFELKTTRKTKLKFLRATH